MNAPSTRIVATAQSLALPSLDAAAAARFARLALDCVHREYPNKISHVMNGDTDIEPPRQLTPAFYGCLDWHSAVHGHWLLARLLHEFPGAPFAAEAREALNRTLTPENIAGDVAYIRAPGRASFERPYGLAWLLQLSAELRRWNDPDAQRWAANLVPLEAAAAASIKNWLPSLRYPIRVGDHPQTAFSFGLIWDWSVVVEDTEMQTLLRMKAQEFYQQDRKCPTSYEPSGEDFLSPCLGEADFMRRVLEPKPFASWLKKFLPDIPRERSASWLKPAIVTDRTDPKLAHIDGLNISRAWMLEGIAAGLPPNDSRIPALHAAAANHASAALIAVTSDHYEGSHWLGTFAVYLTTKAGVDGGAAVAGRVHAAN
ncbi:MAG TPA: DUF2891 domain-containing protein [Steroidobacteraceae bacterium]|nr:DUF2891 domain-containing protein [Steroidobacteraceae bacterium]